MKINIVVLSQKYFSFHNFYQGFVYCNINTHHEDNYQH